MTAVSLSAPAVGTGRLRPLNVLHDLPQVADLIELCFQSTMDDEGQSYLEQMRRASHDQDFLSWAGRLMDSASMPLAGFVWEENGKIIGNASLVFQTHRGRKIAMIANVATDPNYRGRGIGRALTLKAMEGGSQKGAKELWLQVRDDNPTAIRIYADLGFVERARRTTYRSGASWTSPADAHRASSGQEPNPGTAPTVIRHAEARHWPIQYQWLERAHPEEISWYAHWNWKLLGPGLRNYLYRLFMEADDRQWSALSGGRLLATVAWLPALRAGNALWLAAPVDGNGRGLELALEAARHDLAHYRKLTVEYPAGEMVPAIRAAGFEPTRTLIWMCAPATSSGAPRRQS
jgi:ribosomal protein S18 acetylase RimI-like enzyme